MAIETVLSLRRAIPALRRAIPAIHTRYYSRDLSDCLYPWVRHPVRHRGTLSDPLPANSGRWAGYEVATAAGPAFLANANLGGHLWQNTLAQRDISGVLDGLGRIGRETGNGIRNAQSVADALWDIHIAQDRYKRAVLEARLLSAQADRVKAEMKFSDELSQSKQDSAYYLQFLENLSAMERQENDAVRFIVSNIA